MAKKKSKNPVTSDAGMSACTISPVNPPEVKKETRNYAGLLCLGLIIVTLAIYIQVVNHQFVSYDDDVYVTNNPHIAGGITGSNILWAFTSIDAETGNWHPVTWLSHMTDVQFYGLDPRGHHLTNVIIHTISSLLLLFLLFRITRSLWKSSFVAALFALHPLHVESVAWVAERKDVLSAFFWFLSLLFYSEYVKKRKCALYLFSLCSFVLGLMSKPMLVTLPIIMLLMDFWPFDRFRNDENGQEIRPLSGSVPALITEKVPFFICSILSSIVTVYAQRRGGALIGIDELSFTLRMENALTAYVKYIGKTLWPEHLAVLYPTPLSFPLWQVIGSLLILSILTASAVRVRHQYPYVPVGWFWFIVTLVPVIGIIQVGVQSMADRYSYIPLIGLFIIAAWGIPDILKSFKYRQTALSLLAGTVITVSAVLTLKQLSYWRDSISLYRHTLQVTTGNYLIHNNLGLVLARNGDMNAATAEFREAVRISPDDWEAHNNLGLALAKEGNPDAAILEYKSALLLNPDYAVAHKNLGLVLAEKENFDGAIQEFQRVLQIAPDNQDAQYYLGAVIDKKNKQNKAGK